MLRSRRLLGALAVLLSTLLGLGAGPVSADPDPEPLPVVWSSATILAGGLARTLVPGWVPPGANVPDCRLSAQHPRPVILVNFTTGSGWEWMAGAPHLANQGYCVRSFNYGQIVPHDQFPIQAIGDIRESAAELAAYVDRVRADFGVDKVDLVGWSQGGGMTPHYFINFLGGAEKVKRFVAIAPGNHGTDGSGLLRPTTLAPLMQPILLALLPAFGQQVEGSALAEEVYADGDTRPGPHYTTIVTKYDEVATPYTNQFLDGPNVTNILLQDGCAKDHSEHVSIGFSSRTWHHVVNALSPKQATPVPCIPVYPFLGSLR